MHVLNTSKYKKGSDLKQPRKGEDIIFLHYKSMGAFCCHDNQSLEPICPKNLGSLSPTPMMLHMMQLRKIAVCFLWLSLPGHYRVTDEALLAETT